LKTNFYVFEHKKLKGNRSILRQTFLQWRSKGRQVEHAPCGTSLGAQQYTFCSHFKRVLSRNLDQSMLKNAYFMGKTVKIVSSSGAPPPNPRLPPAAGGSASDPRLVIPACYYNSIEFVSSAKCILFRSKKNQVTTANVLPLLLPHFCTYLLIQTL